MSHARDHPILTDNRTKGRIAHCLAYRCLTGIEKRKLTAHGIVYQCLRDGVDVAGFMTDDNRAHQRLVLVRATGDMILINLADVKAHPGLRMIAIVQLIVVDDLVRVKTIE